ncbi:MAG: type II toxin-antitoxin system RelB/DinJ family antitoxin [Oscillospiraceae bacterium]|nr:type II toxin-antitoxin system RelB/DinJ family antitoxin [Oscillospiraceae bacterium]
MAQKSANLYARIEPEVKEKAESILSALGVSVSSAINMFYKQIILHRGIPFDITLPGSAMSEMSSLSSDELSEELEKGYLDMLEGKTKPAEKTFADIRKSQNK